MQIGRVLLAVPLTLRRRMSCGSRWRLNLGQAFRPTWKLITEKPYDRVWDKAVACIFVSDGGYRQ